MILVSDSSALITLALCDTLHLLDELFGEVKVPQAVFDEIAVEDKSESTTLTDYLKYKIEPVELDDFVITDFSIGRGEIEAIALYKMLKADKLLVDDKRARKLAKANGVNIIGSMGILLIAKQKGLIKVISPYIDIIRNSDIYVKEALLQHVLDLAGET